MGLTFLSPLILAGAALIAVPIILHLVMKQVPKKLIFPAIRFLQQREQANRRQLRLRHLLLLFLRCAAIVLLSAALARPSMKAAGPLGSQEAPVAAALIFDTSPRMEYREENRTRLQAAEETARWLLTQLPPESDVAVLPSEEPTGDFSVDLGAAEQHVSKLKTASTATPLTQVINRAIPLLAKKDRQRKEIYVFTDLAAGAWPADPNGQLKSALEAAGDVGLYVIDVGVREPRDFALGDVKVTPEVVAKTGQVQVQTEAIRLGPDDDREVAIYLLDEKTGKPQTKGTKQIHWRAGQSTPIEFSLSAETIGTHQGFIRIQGEDNLAADDVRYFTFDVRPPFPVLIAAPVPVERYTFFLPEALAPSLWRKSGRARFQCETVSLDKLLDKNLDGYAAVCLLDPTPLDVATWQRLRTYVEGGGGLGIWLGHNAQPNTTFTDSAALALLPGKLDRIVPSAGPIEDAERTKLKLAISPTNDDLQHPLMAAFRPIARSVQWDRLKVWRHWAFSDLDKAANVVLHFSDGQPAIFETAVGKGRVLTMTTPISDPANDPVLWNQLPTGFNVVPTFVLSNEMVLYLAGSGEERLNYAAGDRAILRIEANPTQSKFSLLNPQQGEGIDLTFDQKSNSIRVPETAMTAAGNYQVQAGGSEGGVRRGFSANIPAAATSLARIKPEELTALLGAGRFKLAHGREEIDRSVSVGRVGRELYPLLIFLVAAVLAGESWLANRFYKRAPLPETRPRHLAAEFGTVSSASGNGEPPQPAVEPPPLPPTAPPQIPEVHVA